MASTKKRDFQNNTKTRKKKIPRRITSDYLHNSGLYYLQRYAASAEHFKGVMRRKAQRSCMHHKDQDFEKCLKMIDELALKFVKAGLLNDEAFAHGLATSYRRQGLSYKMIQQKMKMKGLHDDQIKAALSDVDSRNNTDTEADPEIRAALTFARKKRLGIFYEGEESRRPDFQKSMGRFARAGFSYDIARKILEMDEETFEQN